VASLGKRLKSSNISREKGISPVAAFRMLFTLGFSDKSLYRTLKAEREAAEWARTWCIVFSIRFIPLEKILSAVEFAGDPTGPEAAD